MSLSNARSYRVTLCSIAVCVVACSSDAPTAATGTNSAPATMAPAPATRAPAPVPNSAQTNRAAGSAAAASGQPPARTPPPAAMPPQPAPMPAPAMLPSAMSAAGAGSDMPGPGDEPAAGSTNRFSFFVTSFKALQRVSGSMDGFGGDLRHGEADGLAGADKICREIAETSMPGAGQKTWRAFLSVVSGPAGTPVHAIDRVGQGPWYDRQGRLLAMTKADLAMPRPLGADPVIANDFPNEDGIPNHTPEGEVVDNHDMLTGSNATGQLFSQDARFTCRDWTSSVGRDGTPRVGHSWPGVRSGANWMSSLTEAGCAAGANLVSGGGPDPNVPTVGSGGGYGGFYCFALEP